MTDLVSYALCEQIVERDARITHFAQRGWWRVTLEGRDFAVQTRAETIQVAASDLRIRLEKDIEA